MVLTAAASPAWEKRAATLQVFLHLRIFRKRLPHQAAGWPKLTDVLCTWSAHKSCKVEARPLRIMPIVKAVSCGRKATTKWDRELIFFWQYDVCMS